PGVKEFEVATEIEYQMRKRGASGAAFETIVAFGERAALPHARPTAKRLRKNELAVLDLGAILGKYCSDITRTVYVGKAPARVRGYDRTGCVRGGCRGYQDRRRCGGARWTQGSIDPRLAGFHRDLTQKNEEQKVLEVERWRVVCWPGHRSD